MCQRGSSYIMLNVYSTNNSTIIFFLYRDNDRNPFKSASWTNPSSCYKWVLFVCVFFLVVHILYFKEHYSRKQIDLLWNCTNHHKRPDLLPSGKNGLLYIMRWSKIIQSKKISKESWFNLWSGFFSPEWSKR